MVKGGCKSEPRKEGHMNKNFYYLVIENIGKKYGAFATKCSENENLKTKIKSQFFVTVTPCKTLKEARARAQLLNEKFTERGEYLYDGTPF